MKLTFRTLSQRAGKDLERRTRTVDCESRSTAVGNMRCLCYFSQQMHNKKRKCFTLKMKVKFTDDNIHNGTEPCTSRMTHFCDSSLRLLDTDISLFYLRNAAHGYGEPYWQRWHFTENFYLHRSNWKRFCAISQRFRSIDVSNLLP